MHQSTVGGQWCYHWVWKTLERRVKVFKFCMWIRYSLYSFVIMNLSLQPVGSVIQWAQTFPAVYLLNNFLIKWKSDTASVDIRWDYVIVRGVNLWGVHALHILCSHFSECQYRHICTRSLSPEVSIMLLLHVTSDPGNRRVVYKGPVFTHLAN